ncbi:MAG: UDP-3-O-acyl-N-acetylglucosamine deacetylase [Aquificaceae bacterium]|jgi:UDP-3-O-[3-hydroxymyristoyl] N-acetylglucosamine deacetylase|uniref:UDP-3-O-acyl-N-acetylglucosamine deacetylase n=1 Tax=Hydrogenobacter sp. Uz 6-8 TaxID=3384828 RepID=UPI000F1E636C|nr:MAG: UDP-3-O-[3-hydroxymyristoyl] N-acetylglucosamine deacetylase [Aquificota bacterium]
MRQKTLLREVEFEGVGIHSGEVSRIVLHPERENTGVRFFIKGTYIPASYRYVLGTDHATVLGKDGVRVSTVEHLLAVLYMLGVDNLTVEFLSGCEVPILDGSGYHFYKLLKNLTTELEEEARVFELTENFEVKNCKGYIRAEPYEGFCAAYRGYVRGLLEEGTAQYCGNAREVVFARTFCYEEEVEFLLQKGLAKGGNLKNAVVIGDGFVYNPEGMRSKDEPIRHKLLDLLGDLSLLGMRLRGKVFSYLGGHSLNYDFVKSLAESSLSTSLMSSSVSTP